MSIVCKEEPRRLSWTDRLLPVWILLSMATGLLLGNYGGENVKELGHIEVAGVSLPIAIGLWMMMMPVLVRVRYEVLPQLLKQPFMARQVAISSVLNWVVGPALMTMLAWVCLPDLENLRNGVILVGLARCIAMVLVWNDLAMGDRELCAVLVALNSILQVVLYTPFTLFYLNTISHTSIHVGFWPVARSVLLFLGIPLVGGVGTRYAIWAIKGREWLDHRFIPYFSPIALLSLVYTIVIMFASQGEQITHHAISVARVSVPLILYFGIMFFSSLFISGKNHTDYAISATQAFTATGNNFELAIAIAVATFGIGSEEAFAATIGPLIEVPALLGLVHVSLWWKHRDQNNATIASVGLKPEITTRIGTRAINLSTGLSVQVTSCS